MSRSKHSSSSSSWFANEFFGFKSHRLVCISEETYLFTRWRICVLLTSEMQFFTGYTCMCHFVFFFADLYESYQTEINH
jgi:hypothetical protein